MTSAVAVRPVVLSGYNGTPIRSFSDWHAHAMPPERSRRHWKEGRSAFELARCWTASGPPCVPPELSDLLASHDMTRGISFEGGITEHETPLPFSNRGPRCHD